MNAKNADGGTPDDPGDAVLIPDDFSIGSLACVRSLGRRGVRTVVASEEGTVSMAAASRYCDEEVTVPSPHRNLLAYKNALLSFVSRAGVKAIIPTREEDAYVLAKYRPAFARHVTALWPSFDAVAAAQDGYRLARIAEDAGVPVPETQRFDEVEDWDRRLIVKPRYAILTPEYVDFFDPTDCDGQNDPLHHPPGPPPDRDEILEYMLGHVPIVQEYVPIEHEFSFRALYDRGEAVKTSVRRQLRGRSFEGGVSVYRELVDRPEIERLGERLLDELEWHGLATVQFIESTDGSLRLMEINPRVWTSIPLDVRAGADYPYFYWALATGRRDRIEPDHELGYGMHNIYGELQYLHSILRERESNADRPSLPEGIAEVVSSTIRDPRFDYLVRDDPMPLVRGVQYRFFGGG